jgi:hypothetical protein
VSRLILIDHPQLGPVEAPFWPRLAAALARRDVRLAFVCDERDAPAGSTAPAVWIPQRPEYWSDLTDRRNDATFLERLDLPEYLLGDDGPLLDLASCWGQADRAFVTRTLAWSRAAYAAALAMLRPDLVVFWNGEQAIQRAARRLTVGCGAATAVLERAPLPGFGYVDATSLLADASFVATPPVAADVGLWHRLRDTTLSKTWHVQPASSADRKPRTPLDVPTDARLLLFAGQVDADTQNFRFSPYAGNLSAFEAFCQGIAQAGRPVYVLGKHHPMADIPAAAYERALRKHGLTGRWREDVSLAEALSACDAVAAVNSSLLFEAAARGLPTLAMGRTILDGRRAFYTTDELSGWLDATDLAARRERFDQAMADLIEHAFFHFEGVAGTRGAEEVADQLVAMLPPDSPDYGPLLGPGLRSLDVFQKAAAEMARVDRLKRPWRRLFAWK